MISSRKSDTHLNLLQLSPTKRAVNLQEARRQHRTRSRSTEFFKLQKFKKAQICKEIQELQSSWNEYQFQKRKEPTLDLQKSISKSLNKPCKTAGIDEASPKPTKGIQLVSRIIIDSTQTARKQPHRTQIYLQTNKTNKHNYGDQVHQKNKRTSQKVLKTVRKHRINTPSQPCNKPFEYLNQIFTTRLKTIFNPIQKKKSKPLQSGIVPSNKKHKISCEDINLSSSFKMDSIYPEQVKEIVNKQIKKVTIRKTSSNKEPIFQSPFSITPLKSSDCSKTQIESILFHNSVTKKH